ncbi:MAG: BrnT family toxin [Betaproteobacteria bacterium]|nr:BrnT family toxin [Betaproteobacteria bacterium]
MAARFEWDPAKDEENQRKHGVEFSEAILAFLDFNRAIARDFDHSRNEERFYCFGKVGDRVLTVRFTYRSGVIRIIGAGYWRRGRRAYEAKQGIH